MPNVDPSLRQLLRDFAKYGSKAEHFAMDDACPVCKSLSGTVYDPREAPPIPVPGCESDVCRCDYLPAD